MSSLAGLYGNAGQVSYSAAKASLIGFTRTLCKESERYKVDADLAFSLVRAPDPGDRGAAGRRSPSPAVIKVGVQPQLLAPFEMVPLGRGGARRRPRAPSISSALQIQLHRGQDLTVGGGLLMSAR